uniref:Uncharacterized protein n=1 Tax=Daucus carota subsp. sativus TaxID=79200 RepID=A0A162A7F0_DAUCS
MCVGAQRSLYDVNGVETPSMLSFFILDEIGHLSYSAFHFCGQIPAVGEPQQPPPDLPLS